MLAIDLDHEPLSGREEISDEAPEKRHLATEGHAEPAAANASPKELLRRRERSAHAASGPVQERDARAVSTAEQGLVVGSSHATQGAGAVTAPRRIETY